MGTTQDLSSHQDRSLGRSRERLLLSEDVETEGSSSSNSSEAATAKDSEHAAAAQAAACAAEQLMLLQMLLLVARVRNPEAAAAASQLLQLLVSHSGFVSALLLPRSEQQHVQPLPAAVAAVAVPLESYMPVVDAVWSSSSSGGDASRLGSSSSSMASLQAAS